jgi:predicted lipoprotein with Yx(FWY)xxD motif
LLGVTRRADGTSQVTYGGHPLYLFLLDTEPGQSRGQDLHDFGAAWYVVSAAGKKIEES